MMKAPTTPRPIKVEKEKHPINWQPLLTLLRSPWFLLTIPLLVGGLWLVQHQSVIMNNLDKPYLLLAGPALIAAGLFAWLIVAFFKSIVNGIIRGAKAFSSWRNTDGSTFWLVVGTFLIVSVTESGTYFNGLFGGSDIYGTLGYATAFVIDLVAVECMRARLRAVRMHDVVGMRLYMFGVVACASLSAYANGYTALAHYVAPLHTLLPWWMVAAAPWTGMSFPVLIIFLAFTADYTADQTSNKLNPEEFKKADDDRQKLLEYQYESLKNKKEFEQKIDTLNGKPQKVQRVFFLWNLLFPTVLDSSQIIKQVNERLDKQEKPIKKEELLALITQAITPEIQVLTTRVISQEKSVITSQQAMENLTKNVAAMTHLVSQLQGVQDLLLSEITLQKQALIADENTSISEEEDEDEDEEKGEISSAAWRTDPDLTTLVIRYPIVKAWLSGSAAAVSAREITEGTGHTTQMINSAIKAKAFARTKRSGFYRISSVIKWLKTAPLPKNNMTDRPIKKDPITTPLGAVNNRVIPINNMVTTGQKEGTNG